MSTQTCPKCGAPLTTSTCQYCGAADLPTAYPGSWTRVADRMPDPSATSPDISVEVLTCFCTEDLFFTDAATGVQYGNYYDNNLISAYYNFKTGIWNNDQYKKGKNLNVNYWLPLPSPASEAWINIKEAFPKFLESETEKVLVCDMGPDYHKSITLGWFDLTFSTWNCLIELHMDSDEPDEDLMAVTHWMPLPASPLA